MRTVASIFLAFNGPASVARAIGVTTEHAASMRRRRSIPVRYWSALLAAAAMHKPALISNQDLIDAHAARTDARISRATSNEAHP